MSAFSTENRSRWELRWPAQDHNPDRRVLSRVSDNFNTRVRRLRTRTLLDKARQLGVSDECALATMIARTEQWMFCRSVISMGEALIISVVSFPFAAFSEDPRR